MSKLADAKDNELRSDNFVAHLESEIRPSELELSNIEEIGEVEKISTESYMYQTNQGGNAKFGDTGYTV